jgi:hypothetical protein
MPEVLADFYLVRTVGLYEKKWPVINRIDYWDHGYVSLDYPSGGYPYFEEIPTLGTRFTDKDRADKEAKYMTEHSDYPCEVIHVQLVADDVPRPNEEIPEELLQHLKNDHHIEVDGLTRSETIDWHTNRHFRHGDVNHWHENPPGVLGLPVVGWVTGEGVHYRPE